MGLVAMTGKATLAREAESGGKGRDDRQVDDRGGHKDVETEVHQHKRKGKRKQQEKRKKKEKRKRKGGGK